MARTYALYNGPTALTTAMPKITTGTAIKTMLQLASSTSKGFRVVEWGIAFDVAAATAIACELIQTDVAATVTAYVAADICKLNGPNDEASTIQIGSTTLSGYTATSEGTTAVSRLGDYQLVSQLYVKQFPLGREFEVPVSKFLRIRVTAAIATNCTCYVCIEE